MASDPINAFMSTMAATQGMINSQRQNARADQQANRLEEESAERLRLLKKEEAYTDGMRAQAKEKRAAATDLARLDAGMVTGADVAKFAPGEATTVAELTPGLAAEEQQRAVVNRFYDSMAKAYQGGELAPEEKGLIIEGAAGLATQGHLFTDLAGIRNQVASSAALKASIKELGEGAGDLIGKKTMIDASNHPELFQQFINTFPAISQSKGFKDGVARPVEFYIDGTNAQTIQEVKIFTVLEGKDKDGKIYRAPMSRRRSSDSDDEVEGAPLGEIYARADFAEQASKALLASIAGMDDAEAQKVIDKHRAAAATDLVKQKEIKQAEELLQDPAIAAKIQADPSGSLAVALKAAKGGQLSVKAFLELLMKETKTETPKTVEIGAGNGMKTQAVLNADGTTTPIGKPYAQFDPQRNSGGAGGGLPAEAKLIDYYITQHGMSKDAAREEAKRAKDSPRKWAGDHYKALIKLESERLLEEGEVRRSPAELQQQALEDARYFFGEAEKSPAPPLSGMAFAPSLNSRPDYPGGPVPVGSPPGKAQPTAKAAPLPPSGFKPTGKMIKGKPAYVSADGKKFWTH